MKMELQQRGALLLLFAVVVAVDTHDQSRDNVTHNDVRCKCVCPNPAVINATHTQRKLYIKNVPPTMCDCSNVVIAILYETMTMDPAHAVQLPEAFCPRCVCRYEQRNTFIIKFVVIMVMAVIGLLVLYLLYLLVEPRLKQRQQSRFTEYTQEEMSLKEYDSRLLQDDEFDDDEDGIALPDVAVTTSRSATAGPSGRTGRGRRGPAILNRVNMQQDRWKQQVEAQRRNIYEQRNILN